MMTPERHQRVKELFLAACELDAPARSALLDDACRGDPELRSEVESLLAHHSRETLIKPAARAAPRVSASGATIRVHAGDTPGAGSAVSELEARFPPGTLVAGRYRIANLLGRGGMGEVYRADDCRLHRTVALKFILPGCGWDGAALARFYQEARVALAVTHPNVCRMYDLGDAGGEPFISMEYVDGETLVSLLRRVGRAPPEKAVELARQLCAALGAAHSAGILHCDLKPGNVMIDGRGRVRLTDFGIAVAADHAAGARGAGTIGYTAPELLEGSAPSVRSDIYALGLVLYELFTGRKAFPEGLDPSQGAQPVPPSRVVEGLDPEVERIILQCLACDPVDRPASVYQVAGVLSGGDPLQAALAAGETPPPEFVVAAGPRGTLRRSQAVAVAAVAVGCFAAVILLADRTCALSGMTLDKSPDVLSEKAGLVLATLGDGLTAGDASGRLRLRYTARSEAQPAPSRLAAPEVIFDYTTDPPTESTPGLQAMSAKPVSTRVLLDASGRLLSYRRSPATTDVVTDNAARSWLAAAALAGVALDSLEPATPNPPAFAAAHRAWQGRLAAEPDRTVRVEGGAIGDRITYYDVVGGPRPAPDAGRDRQSLIREASLALLVITLPAALVLARRNLRAGKGDRRSAWRLGVLLFGLGVLLGLLEHRRVPDLMDEVLALLGVLPIAVFVGVVAWAYYIALEPYVRRLWPLSIVSWTRLLAGRWADPLVGRDVLIGTIAGLGLTLVRQLSVLLDMRLSGEAVPVLPPPEANLGYLTGFEHTVGSLVYATRIGVGRSLILVMFMLLLRLASGSQRIASAVFLTVIAVACMMGSESLTAASAMCCVLMALGILLILVRAGFLSLVACLFVMFAITSGPITSNFQTWYAGSMAYTLFAPALLVLLGLRLSAARSAGVLHA